jgi:hypothetical protein
MYPVTTHCILSRHLADFSLNLAFHLVNVAFDLILSAWLHGVFFSKPIGIPAFRPRSVSSRPSDQRKATETSMVRLDFHTMREERACLCTSVHSEVLFLAVESGEFRP